MPNMMSLVEMIKLYWPGLAAVEIEKHFHYSDGLAEQHEQEVFIQDPMHIICTRITRF